MRAGTSRQWFRPRMRALLDSDCLSVDEVVEKILALHREAEQRHAR